MSTVVIIDTGCGNIGSLRFALQRLGTRAELTRNPARIRAATHVVLPGVGAARRAMRVLNEAGLRDVIVRLSQPVLGICLGMQLLYEHSEEGPCRGLGVISGGARRLCPAPGLRVPHMGWNQVQTVRPGPLPATAGATPYAYFVHSYACAIGPETQMAVEHTRRFSALVQVGNFFGTQFHPERSGAWGAALLARFLELDDADYPRD